MKQALAFRRRPNEYLDAIRFVDLLWLQRFFLEHRCRTRFLYVWGQKPFSGGQNPSTIPINFMAASSKASLQAIDSQRHERR